MSLDRRLTRLENARVASRGIRLFRSNDSANFYESLSDGYDYNETIIGMDGHPPSDGRRMWTQVELDAAQRALVATASRRLAHGLEKSVTTALNLAELSEDEAIRLRAALAIPTMLRDLREHGDILERIAVLELAVNNGKH